MDLTEKMRRYDDSYYVLLQICIVAMAAKVIYKYSDCFFGCNSKSVVQLLLNSDRLLII
jgi:hypothetical protein